MKPLIILFANTFLFISTIGLSVYQARAQDTTSCVDHAMNLYKAGNYSEAYKSFSGCLKNTSDTASYHTCLVYLGVCALEKSEFKNASILLHNAERSCGYPSNNYFICQQSLAALSKRQGYYNEAEIILLKLLEVQKKSVHSSCALTAITLNDLGVIYKRLGQYERSIQYLSESLELKRTCLDPEDPSIIISLNNLAGVFMKQKEYEKADSLYTAAIKIKIKQHGPNHPSTLIARNNLAELYRQLNNYDAALIILDDVRVRKASTLGKHSLSYATTLHTIANVYFSSGNFVESLKVTRESISIKQKLIGKTASSTLHGYALLAKINHALGKNQEARSIYDFILKIKQEEIDTYFKYLGEEEKVQYVKAHTTYWKEFTTFVFDINADSSNRCAANKLVFNQWIENRWVLSDLILEETQRQHRLWENITDTIQLKLVEELSELKDAIAKTYLLKSKDDTKLNNELNELTDRATLIEKKLTSIPTIENHKHYSVADIINALDSTECIVEIIKTLQHSGKYLALIYLQGSKTPYKIWLAESSLLDGKGYAYYRNMIQFKQDDAKSYNLYWKAIDDFLSDYNHIHTIYLVRNGIYECMNIHTLLTDTNKKLQSIILLNKTENILSYKKHLKKVILTKTAFIYHPIYGLNATDCAYADLPGTKTEVDSIEKLFNKKFLQTVRYSEHAATETAIKNDTVSYSLIHIATHGYLDMNPEDDYIESMIHSGLLFSGVCDIPGIDSETDDDGILTSYEIAQLNLSKTELVVLSACQSGLGTIDNQEGMLGLQRGLLIAGAKKVLVSLWKIDDVVTAEWMYYFYSNLVETNSCSDAYRYAQEIIKARYVAPYYWGAFVLLEQ